jgi:hypothetical protein
VYILKSINFRFNVIHIFYENNCLTPNLFDNVESHMNKLDLICEAIRLRPVISAAMAMASPSLSAAVSHRALICAVAASAMSQEAVLAKSQWQCITNRTE